MLNAYAKQRNEECDPSCALLTLSALNLYNDFSYSAEYFHRYSGFCPGFFERWAGRTCPFRCLQTVVALTVCMDKLDCHVIK